jgi:hypothetical protein
MKWPNLFSFYSQLVTSQHKFCNLRCTHSHQARPQHMATMVHFNIGAANLNSFTTQKQQTSLQQERNKPAVRSLRGHHVITLVLTKWLPQFKYSLHTFSFRQQSHNTWTNHKLWWMYWLTGPQFKALSLTREWSDWLSRNLACNFVHLQSPSRNDSAYITCPL